MTLVEDNPEPPRKRTFKGRVGVFQWSATAEEQLTKLWSDGWSGSEIAREMGARSRNVIIGKLHRLRLTGLERPPGPGRVKARHRPTPKRALPPRPEPDIGGGTIQRLRNTITRNKKGAAERNHERPGGADGGLLFRIRNECGGPQLPEFKRLADEPAALNHSLFDLTDATCRWPHGEGPYLFCGHTTEELGRSYCAFHNRLSVGRQPPHYSEAEREIRRRRALQHLAALQATRGNAA